MQSQPREFESAVSITQASKFFGSTVAVNQLNLDIPKGTILGLIGPNGSGKTTTIRMIVGISPPTQGEVNLFGQRTPAEVIPHIGYVPETNGLIQRLKVIDYIVFNARLHHISKKEAVRKAEQMLERFEIADTRNKACSAMSKGMAQKIQMICAMLHEPALLILDEPFSGLDPVNMELVKDAILEFRSPERTVLFSTHIMEHAEQICDSVVMINKGRVLLNGTLDEVRASRGNCLSIEFEGDADALNQIPGITGVTKNGSSAQLDIDQGVDRQQILRDLLDHVELKQFDFGQVSLHDVFIHAVAHDSSSQEQKDGVN